MRWYVTLAAMPLVFAMPCTAESTTALIVLQGCGATVKQIDGSEISIEESIASTWCVGYVSGMLDGVRIAPQLNKGPPLVCSPEGGITNEQAVRVVVKYLRAKPEILHESARIHVLIALAKAFPCPR